jgi:cardiolipin synthase
VLSLLPLLHAATVARPAELCADWEAAGLGQRLDVRTRSEERAGNRVTLLVDGVEAFGRRVENSADADLILVKTFLWNNDEVGRATARMLADRARAGATVVVQYDFKANAPTGEVLREWLASGGPTPDAPPPLDILVAAGVVVVPTNVPDRPREIQRAVTRADGEGASVDALASEPGANARNLRFRARGGLGEFDHEKYWITGRRTSRGVELRAILGGLNVGSEYAWGGTPRTDVATGRGGWRDTDVEVEGPVVTDIAGRFFDLLALNAQALPPSVDRADWVVEQQVAGDADVRFVWTHPGLGRKYTVERLYRTLIGATPASAPLSLETAYFAPAPATFRQIRAAARRGVGLTVLTNSAGSIDVPLVADASLAAYDALLRIAAGAALYHWQKREGAETLHSKVASFGRCGPAIVGSANLDGLSAEHNSESVLLIRDPAFRASFDEMFAADLPRGQRYTLQDADRVWFLGRWWNAFVYGVGWYWL